MQGRQLKPQIGKNQALIRTAHACIGNGFMRGSFRAHSLRSDRRNSCFSNRKISRCTRQIFLTTDVYNTALHGKLRVRSKKSRTANRQPEFLKLICLPAHGTRQPQRTCVPMHCACPVLRQSSRLCLRAPAAAAKQTLIRGHYSPADTKLPMPALCQPA